MKLFCLNILCLVLALLSTHNLGALDLEEEIRADSVLLINADTGAVLYEKNSHKRQYPASITKVATALFAIADNAPFLDEVAEAEWDSIASISPAAKRQSKYRYAPHWLEVGSSHMGIKQGERFSIRELLHGMLITTANDAATVIAQYLGGSVANYMDGVNSYLEELGCKDSHFLNPSGLHHPKQYSTAWDMGIIAREALKYPLFREIVSASSWRRPKTNMQDPVHLAQTNKLLRRGKLYDPRALGIKTGYTSDAKNTFIAAAEFDGRTLIAVLMKVNKRDHMFEDASRLFDAAFFETKEHRSVLAKGKQGFTLALDQANHALKVETEEELAISYYPSESPKLRVDIDWDDKLSLPIAKGTRVGVAELRAESGELMASCELFASNHVDYAWIPWARQSWEACVCGKMLFRWLAYAAICSLVLALCMKVSGGGRS